METDPSKRTAGDNGLIGLAESLSFVEKGQSRLSLANGKIDTAAYEKMQTYFHKLRALLHSEIEKYRKENNQ